MSSEKCMHTDNRNIAFTSHDSHWPQVRNPWLQQMVRMQKETMFDGLSVWQKSLTVEKRCQNP